MVATSTTNPRAAQLIRNLAIADFFWFSAAMIQSTYWVFTDKTVPDVLCYICAPLVNFTRMSSLIWTSAISFDVLQSVNKRKWNWQAQGDESEWQVQRRWYWAAIILASAPGAVLNVIKQHSAAGNANLGCNAGYEKIGDWYEVFFTELLPITIGK